MLSNSCCQRFKYKILGNSIVFLSMALVAVLPEVTSGQTTGVAIKLSDNSLNSIAWASRTPPSRIPFALLLPGILGEQVWDRSIKLGLEQSEFSGEAYIYDWTRGPLMAAANIGGNHQQVSHVVKAIVQFKTKYPYRPLYLVGHSGGCRMVVNVLENLPRVDLVERAVLLSPCLESNYNLTRALAMSNCGIVSFNSPLDVPISVPLTAVRGMFQGRMDVSATVAGFRLPKQPQLQQIYEQKLVQKRFQTRMISTGNLGGHFGWTKPKFVAQFVAPELKK